MGQIAGVAGLGLQAFGAVKRHSAQQQQASAIEAQAAMARQTAKFNSFQFLERSRTQRFNAKHAQFLSRFTLQQTRFENQINLNLAETEYKWSNMFADHLQAVGQAKKRAFNKQAKNVIALGEEGQRRHVRSGRRFLGKQRASTAAAGVTAEGSPMEAYAEAAELLELERLDIMVEANTQAQNLRYQGALAEYEGDVNAQFTRFRAKVTKYHAEVNAYNNEQAGYIAALGHRMQAFNFKRSARDLKNQSRLALIYGDSEANGLLAQAQGVRANASANLFSSLGGVAMGAANMFRQGAF